MSKRLTFVLLLIGYCWGVVYLLVDVIHQHWWAVAPLVSAVLSGYFILTFSFKTLWFIGTHHDSLALVGRLLTNMVFLLKKAVKDEDPRYQRFFGLLTLSPEEFRSTIGD